MAKFKISLLNLTNNTKANNVITFSPSVISEFYSQDVIDNYTQYSKQIEWNKQQEHTAPEEIDYINYLDKDWDLITKYHTYCYTYDESFSKHSNGQKELSFKMNKMILKGDEWIENPYARLMLPGVQLCLQDLYDNQYLFTITTVKYNFKESNIVYEISCQDSFSQQLSTQNDGYEIQNEPTKSDFIGAKDVDFWAKKIAEECYIPYLYLPLSQGLYLCNNDGTNFLTSSLTTSDKVVKIIKQSYYEKDYPEYYDLIPFAGSGNADSILISLGEKIGFMLNCFEFSADNNQFQRYFWFEPKKHEDISGLVYSPYNSIKTFDLTHNGKSLTTILNVISNKSNNKIVSLLPSVPSFFIQIFNSKEWDKSGYTPKMYSEMIYHKEQHYEIDEIEDLRIWHRTASSGTYLDSFDNVQVENLPITQLGDPDIENYDVEKIYKYNNYILIPISTSDQDSFTIPPYDEYSFVYENKNSYISFLQNNQEKNWDAMRQNFYLAKVYSYKAIFDQYQYNFKTNIDSSIFNGTSLSVIPPQTIKKEGLNTSFKVSLKTPQDDRTPHWITITPRAGEVSLAYGGYVVCQLGSITDVSSRLYENIKEHSFCNATVSAQTYKGEPTYDISGRGYTVTFDYHLIFKAILADGTIESWDFVWYTDNHSERSEVLIRQYYENANLSLTLTMLYNNKCQCDMQIGNTSYSYTYNFSNSTGTWDQQPEILIVDDALINDPSSMMSYLADVSSLSRYWKIELLQDYIEQYRYAEIKSEKDLENSYAQRMYLCIWDPDFDLTNSIIIQKENLNLQWTRTPINEEIEFAEIADEVPWLENKLIDFSYYYNRQIINAEQYSSLTNTIYNDLRKANGKLIFYTNAYYNALHYQTTKMADLLNSLEGLSAIFNANVITPLRTKGAVSNIQQFESSYNLVFNSTLFDKKEELLNYDSILSDYVNKYFSAQQRFLKNIYNFKKYFNENVAIYSSNSQIYRDTLTITNDSNNDYYYSFKQANQFLSRVNNTFNYYDDNYTPLFSIYYKQDNNTYGLVEVADGTNYSNLEYATIEAEGNYVAATGSFEDNKQYYQKAWLLDNCPDNLQDTQYIALDSNDNTTDYNTILLQIENKTRRLWTIAAIEDNHIIKNYVYANINTNLNGNITLYSLQNIKEYFQENPNNDISNYIAWSGNIHYTTDITQYTYIAIQLKNMQQNYMDLMQYNEAHISSFLGENNATDVIYIPTPNWHMKKVGIYTEASKLFWYKDYSGSWLSKVWQYNSGNNNYTFNSPWTWTCYSNIKDFSNLLFRQQLNLMTASLYATSLPIDSLFLYTHKYIELQKNLYVVNKKGQTFEEWYTAEFKDQTPTVTEITTNQNNPYNYIDYFSIPFVNYKNYLTYSYKRFLPDSWMSLVSNPVVASIANLGFLGLTIDDHTAYTLSSIINMNNTSTSTYFDNIAYAGDTTKLAPGRLIYSSDTSSTLSRTYYNQGVIKENYQDIYEWSQDNIAFLKDHSEASFSKTNLALFNDCCIHSMVPDDEVEDNIKCIYENPYSYISYYKYHHHTFGTLLDTVRNNYQRPDFYDNSLGSGDTLYFKDVRLTLLSENDQVTSQDKIYFLPFFDNTYVDSNQTNVISDSDEWWERWLGQGQSKDIDAFVNIWVWYRHGGSNAWFDICKRCLDDLTYTYNFKDQDFAYISKISCYPWMNAALQLEPSTDFNTPYKILYKTFGENSFSFDNTHNYPFYTISRTVKNESKTYYGIIVREENYSKEPIDFASKNCVGLYEDNNGAQVQWTKLVDISTGYYWHDNQDTGFVSAQTLSKFDPSLHYYKNGERIYTIMQILQQNDYYYFTNNVYEEINWNPDKLDFNLPVYKYKIIKEGQVIKGMQQVGDSFMVSMHVPSALSKLTGYSVQPFGDSTVLTATGVKEADLANVSNGNFWFKYHDNIEYPSLFEYAAAIETKLQEYWSTAYNASLYCEYFIPQYWQPSNDGVKNYFAQKMYNTNDDTITFSNWLPDVSIVNVNNTNKFPWYTFHYNSDANPEKIYQPIEVIQKFPWYNDFKTKFGNLFWNGFTVQENGDCNYYTATGGIVKSDLFQDLQIGNTSFSKFDGIYSMVITVLLKDYLNKPLNEYQYYYNLHNTLWKTLYTLYPSVLMENKFENSDATTSKDLLTMAKYAFKDLSHPERGYNISIINNIKDFINYQGQELKIGDPIKLASNEFYDRFDDIKDSLDQFLFITDISYKLREDNGISITVNSIKYQDKLIQRLVKLIQ